jgi:low affinity Fe/Cu permease
VPCLSTIPPRPNQTSPRIAGASDREASANVSPRLSPAGRSTAAFSVATVSVVVWAATGPLFHWSDTWQVIMNTASSIVTFLMVFLMQRSQNKDTLAIHVKLNEIISSMEGASKGLVSVEDLSEVELQTLKARYQRMVDDVGAEQASRRL